MSIISNFASLLRLKGKLIQFPSLESSLEMKAFNESQISFRDLVLGESLLGKSETLAGPSCACIVGME